ncbi:SGNH/GDSL hydrolase family protein [Sporosarcina siberiensis]|uniref:SGNH/GDSL hydrolase family protein n=1 Tax=Sporosarcina siberiensis TaxID=1365606 RepID=A0ABW4SIC9_9BACL
MTKKVLFAYIVLIGCILLLVGGYSQWKDKLSSFQRERPTQTVVSAAPVTEVEQKETVEEEEAAVEPMDSVRLQKLTANQDESVRALFQKRLDSSEKVDFLMIGSTSMDYGDSGYAERLQVALGETYAEFITFHKISFDGTSSEFMKEIEEERITLDGDYDVVLMEPFTLRNNGKVIIEKEHAHIKTVRGQLSGFVEDSVLILQPPNPIYKMQYYETQVRALNTFAGAQGIPYINHWLDWPAKDSADLPLLLGENSMPNSDGAELWANALIGYFIAE